MRNLDNCIVLVAYLEEKIKRLGCSCVNREHPDPAHTGLDSGTISHSIPHFRLLFQPLSKLSLVAIGVWTMATEPTSLYAPDTVVSPTVSRPLSEEDIERICKAFIRLIQGKKPCQDLNRARNPKKNK